jgi:hypothetical protein
MTALKVEEKPGQKTRIKSMGWQLLASFHHLTHMLAEKMLEEKVPLLSGFQKNIFYSLSLEAHARTVHPNKLRVPICKCLTMTIHDHLVSLPDCI